MIYNSYYKGMTVLITGASAGFGEAFARQLAPIAGKLILVARRIERLDALKSELVQQHPELRIANFSVDLGNEAARLDFLNQLANQNQHIDILINNAGLGDIGRFRSSEWVKINSMLEVNMAALTHLTHALLPGMLNARKGGILNISSVSAILPFPKLAVYAATKSFVTSFSEALRIELLDTGVRVTAVCPGPVETEFGLTANRNQRKGLPFPKWIQLTSKEIAEISLNAFAKNKAQIFPGFAIKLFKFWISIIPNFILRRLLAWSVK